MEADAAGGGVPATRVCVLERVVQDRRGHDLVSVSGAIQQRCDLEQVEDERGAIRHTALAAVAPFGVVHRLAS